MKDVNDMTNGELVDEVIRQLKIDFPDKSEEELRITILMAGDSQQHNGLVFKITDARPEDRLKAMVENSRRKIEDMEKMKSEYDLIPRPEELVVSHGAPRVIKKGE